MRIQPNDLPKEIGWFTWRSPKKVKSSKVFKDWLRDEQEKEKVRYSMQYNKGCKKQNWVLPSREKDFLYFSPPDFARKRINHFPKSKEYNSLFWSSSFLLALATWRKRADWDRSTEARIALTGECWCPSTIQWPLGSGRCEALGWATSLYGMLWRKCCRIPPHSLLFQIDKYF